ncbi:UDP-N-acetylglucosamine 2-epimerase [Thalassobacillus sp. CUG 92003]|uniref:UDP-N-acetylglucosamine 2-epimerase n=1 Tax=Thalassobacillus sp. CUG 92003 TaxID=2736641 RepID=UPI0015E66F19|nr:UDP-N-acetylglucosamine 2-epimerase [Thalassobacillus sp. CUG 92003]
MTAKHIICFTGTRADYGIYRPLLLKLQQEENIRLQLVVTGMHVLKEYGSTVEGIRKDGFEIIASPSILYKGDSTCAMSQSVGTALLYFSSILEQFTPDGILVLGDRGEMLAAAISAHYQNIMTFHLHGGEQSGSADDAIRHAISKLSHVHFVSTHQSKQRLIAMGIEGSCIVTTGSLRKHDIVNVTSATAEKIKGWKQAFKIAEDKQRVLVVMHPDSKESLPFEEQINHVLQALIPFDGLQLFILGSNSDAGGETFTSCIHEMLSYYKDVTYVETLSPDDYLFLLANVDVLIGNSSSGIIEAPFFNLPFINVGNRQKSRERGTHVWDVDYDKRHIHQTLKIVLSQSPVQFANPYDVLDSPRDVIVQEIKSRLFG